MELFTDKNFPLNKVWVFKLIGGALIYTVLESIFLIIVVSAYNSANAQQFPFKSIIIIALILSAPLIIAILNVLVRTKLHFGIEEKFLVLDEGVISKKHRTMPYGVIQNILVEQNFFGRIFGYSTLIIENAAGEGRFSQESDRNKRKYEHIGSYGNKFYIPGLTVSDANRLKEILLEKMKENPMADTFSGL